MKFFVKVIPNASKPEVTVIDSENLKVRVDAPAKGGKANARLIELLAAHFRIRKSSVMLLSGATSKRKIVEIEMDR